MLDYRDWDSIFLNTHYINPPLMHLPKLENKSRTREFRSYTLKETDEVVYNYVFNGFSTRVLDSKVLGKDPIKSKGWQSHGILKYYGLGNDFKGIFKGMTPEEAIAAIPENNPAYVLTDLIKRCSNIEITDKLISINETYEFEIRPGEEKSALQRIRINQHQFRDAVLRAYGGACCITGIWNTKLLVASHIIPWSKSSSFQKTDPCNGLCLNRMHDAAFDAGLMTINCETLNVEYSLELEDTMPESIFNSFFKGHEGRRIMASKKGFEPNINYLRYHNFYIFEKNSKCIVSEFDSFIDEILK